MGMEEGKVETCRTAGSGPSLAGLLLLVRKSGLGQKRVGASIKSLP